MRFIVSVQKWILNLCDWKQRHAETCVWYTWSDYTPHYLLCAAVFYYYSRSIFNGTCVNGPQHTVNNTKFNQTVRNILRVCCEMASSTNDVHTLHRLPCKFNLIELRFQRCIIAALQPVLIYTGANCGQPE